MESYPDKTSEFLKRQKNRFANPDHPLVAELRKVPLITKPRGTQEELQALHQQAHALAQLLCDWNESGAVAET